MNKILFFLFALIIGFIAVGAYFRFANVAPNDIVQIKIPFVGSQFSLENAPSESLKGKIISMTGKVNWESRIATEEAELSKDTTLQQGEQIDTKEDGNITVQFGDKASVIISPKTQIDIIQTLKEDVVFSQASGSAVYKKTGDYPVSVRVKHILVENGGQVSVSMDEVNPSLITISADSGSSTLAFNDQDYMSNKVILTERQKYLFNDDTRQGDLK